MVPGGYTLSMTLTPSEWSRPQSQSIWCHMTLFLVTPDATAVCYQDEYNYVFPNPLMSFLFIFIHNKNITTRVMTTRNHGTYVKQTG